MAKKVLLFLRKNFFLILSLLLFFAARFYILQNPPKYYSDVSHFYTQYIDFWFSGLIPYLKHLYEYPPATIPILVIPHLIKIAGFGSYYLNYRLLMFLIEIIFYFFLIKTINKTSSGLSKYLSIIFYNVACLIVKDHLYEGIDLVFIASLTFCLISLVFNHKNNIKNKVIFWLFFWLSVAIKIVTLPLLIPFLIIKKVDLKKEIIACLIGFLIVWAIPLLIFRSSLSVIAYFHMHRPLHASSFPAEIVYTIDFFTHSETMTNLEWFGPYSQKALRFSFLGLAANVILIIIWSIFLFSKNRGKNQYDSIFRISLVYIIGFLFTSKIFSTSFNIWYLPLLTIYPYKNIKEQLMFYFLTLWSLVFNTTNLFNNLPYIVLIYPFTVNYLRHFFRFPPLLAIALLTLTSRQTAKLASRKYHKGKN